MKGFEPLICFRVKVTLLHFVGCTGDATRPTWIVGNVTSWSYVWLWISLVLRAGHTLLQYDWPLLLSRTCPTASRREGQTRMMKQDDHEAKNVFGDDLNRRCKSDVSSPQFPRFNEHLSEKICVHTVTLDCWNFVCRPSGSVVLWHVWDLPWSLICDLRWWSAPQKN